MRQRTTFVHGFNGKHDPRQLHAEYNAVHVKSLKAAREDRLTLSLYELPQELWRVLKQCHELHIRWASANPYLLVAPFVSTVSPGLHVFYTPLNDRPANLLCPLLAKSFGSNMICTSSERTFTGLSILSERFASSAAYQYHEDISSLNDLVVYIRQTICADTQSCKAMADALLSADYFDFDYDTISQSVVLSAFWHAGPDSGKWDEQIDDRNGSVKLEVGVLANEKPSNPEELALGGFLVVPGKDEKPSPTLFSFPSRHHLASSISDANYSTVFRQPTGLHPTLRLTLLSSMKSPSPECALHTYLTLPSYLFVDKYQLSSPNFLASNNLHLIRSLSGEADLEAPDWAIWKWGSTLLLELAPPGLVGSSSAGNTWIADIPLHLRYLPPVSGQHSGNCSITSGMAEYPPITGGQRTLPVPWPIVFWACPTDEGTKMNTNPFDRVNLGYEGLFGPRTMFYHLQPSSHGRPLREALKAPIIEANGAGWVGIGTVVVVSWGFLWICGILIGMMTKDLRSSGTTMRKKKA